MCLSITTYSWLLILSFKKRLRTWKKLTIKTNTCQSKWMDTVCTPAVCQVITYCKRGEFSDSTFNSTLKTNRLMCLESNNLAKGNWFKSQMFWSQYHFIRWLHCKASRYHENLEFQQIFFAQALGQRRDSMTNDCWCREKESPQMANREWPDKKVAWQ